MIRRCCGVFATVIVLMFVARHGSVATAVPTGRAASNPRSALVIGDSVLAGTYGNIPADLPGWSVTMDATVDRSTDQGLAEVRKHGTSFGVVVVQLGTNDGGTPSVYQPRLEALMNALAPVPRVIFLTIRVARPYYAETNQIIRQVAAAHPNVSVGDWNAAWLPTDTGDDGLHLTPSGSVHMAQFVAGLISHGPAPTTTTSTTTSTTTTTTTIPPTTVVRTTPPTVQGLPVAVRSSATRRPSSKGDAPWWILAVGLAAAVVVAAAVLGRRKLQGAKRDG